MAMQRVFVSKKKNKSRSVVYNIFERESINSILLYKISEALDFNFFSLFEISSKENDVIASTPFYGDGWKIKYFDLLEKHNNLLESNQLVLEDKLEVFFNQKKKND